VRDNFFESEFEVGRCETEGATISRGGVMVELHETMLLTTTSSGGVYSAADDGLVILPSLCTQHPPKTMACTPAAARGGSRLPFWAASPVTRVAHPDPHTCIFSSI